MFTGISRLLFDLPSYLSGHFCVFSFLMMFVSFRTEKAALLSPDDEVQKSDISSSSQGLVEKEELGPMLLEVNTHTHTVTRTIITTAGIFTPAQHTHTHPVWFSSFSCSLRPSMGFSSSSTERAALSSFPRTWRVTLDTPRRSWWPQVSTASSTWETTMNLFAICCLKAWVSEPRTLTAHASPV